MRKGRLCLASRRSSRSLVTSASARAAAASSRNFWSSGSVQRGNGGSGRGAEPAVVHPELGEGQHLEVTRREVRRAQGHRVAHPHRAQGLQAFVIPLQGGLRGLHVRLGLPEGDHRPVVVTLLMRAR